MSTQQIEHLRQLRSAGPPLFIEGKRFANRVTSLLIFRPWIAALTYIVLFLPLTLILSSRTPLTSDEVYTTYISRLPSAGAILHALAEGADLQPPAIYFL